VKALLVLVGLLGMSPHVPGTAPHQSLSITLNAESASTKRLPHYRAAAPIAVHVAGDARKFDAVTVTATGPDGTAIRAPLARTSDGFDGALRLVTPGAWTVGLTTQMGAVSNAIATVPLDVEPGDGSELAGYLTMLFAALLTAAGIIVLVRRQALATAIATVWARKRN
jgi:hypothetical protein